MPKYLRGLSEDRIVRRIKAKGEKISLCKYDDVYYLTDTYFLIKVPGLKDYRKITSAIIATAGELPSANGETVGVGANKELARMVAEYFAEAIHGQSKEVEITNWLYVDDEVTARVVETPDGLRFFNNELVELFDYKWCTARLVERTKIGLLVFSWADLDIGLIVEYRPGNVRLPGEKKKGEEQSNALD